MVDTFRFVLENFVIPQNFELIHKFGALSGLSYEERVIDAYMWQLFEPVIVGVDLRTLLMCHLCGRTGHFPAHCPDGL